MKTIIEGVLAGALPWGLVLTGRGPRDRRDALRRLGPRLRDRRLPAARHDGAALRRRLRARARRARARRRGRRARATRACSPPRASWPARASPACSWRRSWPPASPRRSSTPRLGGLAGEAAALRSRWRSASSSSAGGAAARSSASVPWASEPTQTRKAASEAARETRGTAAPASCLRIWSTFLRIAMPVSACPCCAISSATLAITARASFSCPASSMSLAKWSRTRGLQAEPAEVRGQDGRGPLGARLPGERPHRLLLGALRAAVAGALEDGPRRGPRLDERSRGPSGRSRGARSPSSPRRWPSGAGRRAPPPRRRSRPRRGAGSRAAGRARPPPGCARCPLAMQEDAVARRRPRSPRSRPRARARRCRPSATRRKR